MSAPAVKPALPAPSGAQAPRVGSGAPNANPSNTPPVAASGAPKLSPSSVSVSPVKPPIPTNANHAVSAPVPLSLVQEHKVQSNAIPQQPVAMQRTPEKPKDLVALTISSSQGPKPTSNGVEGSPSKAPPSVQIPPTIAESKKTDDALSATALLNHSTESSAPASAAGPISSPAGTIATNASVSATVPVAPATVSVTTNVNTPTVTHASAINAQQLPAKTEPLVPPAAPLVSSASALPVTAAAPPKSNTSGSNSSSNTSCISPGKNDMVSAVTTSTAVTTNTTTATSANTVSANVESKPTGGANAPSEDSSATPLLAAPASGPGPGTAPAPETLAKPTPPAPPEVTKTRIEISKPEFKVATPPRVSKRKRETKPVVETKAAAGDPNDDRKSKRVRTRTQPYQSPLPELTYIAKIKNIMKSADDKLIVFYKNEFLAVRNAEGSFYVCQAMQNIYKSSTRIRIRWLSQDKKDNKETNVYIPDFYDVTEFDCILTNLELKKLDKNKYQLPQEERERTQSILKRALDVEKGVVEKPPITEEHPDGLDLSLYRDEAQLKKRSAPKASKKSKKSTGKVTKEGKIESGETDTSEDSTGEGVSGESEEDGGGSVEKKKTVNKTPKSKVNKKEKLIKGSPVATTKDKISKTTREKDGGSPKKERTSERGREREAIKRRAEASVATTANTTKNAGSSKAPPEKKAKVASSSTPKPVRKTDKSDPSTADTSVPTRATKSRSAKTAAATAPPPSNKTSPVTRTKERERRAVTTSSRKKPGKKA